MVEGSARRVAGVAGVAGGNELQGSQDSNEQLFPNFPRASWDQLGVLGVFQDAMFAERELSSLQQRMRNSRAQTAYTMQHNRQSRERGVRWSQDRLRDWEGKISKDEEGDPLGSIHRTHAYLCSIDMGCYSAAILNQGTVCPLDLCR